jgi:hypothetical protein
MSTIVKNRLASPPYPHFAPQVSLTKSRKNSQAKPIFRRNYNKIKILTKTPLGSLLAFPQRRTLPRPSHRVMFQRPMSECSLKTEYRKSRPSVSAGRALRQGDCLHRDPTLPNECPVSSGSGTRPTWRAAGAARVILFGIRGTMRMRFANSAVLFSFGFSALTADPAQFGQDSGDENYPAPAANTGARHAGGPSCANLYKPTACVTSIKVSK